MREVERGWEVPGTKLSLAAMMGHTHTNISLIEKKDIYRYPRELKKFITIHKIHEIEYNFFEFF